jgi:hypothetical protein
MNKLEEKSEPGARTKTTSRKKTFTPVRTLWQQNKNCEHEEKMNSLTCVHCGSKTKTASMKKNGSTGTAGLDPQQSQRETGMAQPRRKIQNFIEIHIRFLQLQKSLSSLPYLIIGMKIEFLAHFYFRKYENEIGK